MMGRLRALALIPLLLLSGCIAAAAPLMSVIAVAGTAASGFGLYKSVQTASGGTIDVSFASSNGKPTPAPPMPSVRRVAVWPGDQGDVHLAERLQASGRYQVVAPAAVNAILAKSTTPVDLNQLTDEEQLAAFADMCRKAHVEFVFAAKSLGETTDANTFSFSRANITYRADLYGYHCGQHAIVWRDQIALKLGLGGSTPSTSEILQVASDAWADRVLGASPPPAHS